MTFDDLNLVANAGLLLVTTLVVPLRLERLINSTLDALRLQMTAFGLRPNTVVCKARRAG